MLSSLKSEDAGGSSAQSLIHALSGLSGQGADDVASVISNFLEGLGSAAGISVDDGGGAQHAMAFGHGAGDVLGASPAMERMSNSFTTQGEDMMFVDSLFQVDEEL